MPAMASTVLRLSALLLTLQEPVQSAATYAQMTTAANKTAINSYNSFMAKAMAALAKLAYCGPGPTRQVPYGTENAFKSSATKGCGGYCTKAGFSLGRIEVIDAKDGGIENANFAYVARLRPEGKQTPPADCVLAIRGTWVHPANDNRNQQKALVDWPMPSCKNKGCKVHSGAKTIWGLIKGGVIDSLKGMRCSSLVVTGHSLGGQLAALAMFSLKDQYGYKIELSYTFEASVPFNKAATAVFDGGLFDRPVSLFRITHTSDKIVRFPDAEGYLQPGYQVWFYGPGRLDYIHCGPLAEAPTCGVNMLPSDQLCSMKKNPAWKKCGGVAPSGGPHCTHPIAPAQNFCDMAGSSDSNFAAGSLFSCTFGNGLHTKAQLPTVPPQVFPPVPASTTQETKKDLPGSTTVNEFAGVHFDSDMPSCWTKNTAYAPLGMLGKTMKVKPTMLSCQQYCNATEFCEYASWWARPDGSGWCHLSGGWAIQFALAPAMSGPKDCKHPLPEESSVSRRVYMEVTYLQSLSGGNFGAAAPMVRFNERSQWQAAASGSFSLSSFVAFGVSMLVLGAAAALLLSRAVSLRWVATRRATVALSSSMHYLDADEGLE